MVPAKCVEKPPFSGSTTIHWTDRDTSAVPRGALCFENIEKRYNTEMKKQLPPIGFGTADISGDITEAVVAAICAGHRLIDTARVYGSERYVGKAIARCISDGIIRREDLFVQTKLDPSLHSYEGAIKSFHTSLEMLGITYVDQYLIHWPVPRGCEDDCYERNRAVWKAFETLQENGETQHIGVCNFLERHLIDIAESARILPETNQLELHPGFQQRGLVRFCRRHGMTVEAWSPMGRGVLQTAEFEKMAAAYGKDVGQLALRWSIQNGFIPLTRSSSQTHIKANLNVFDFHISPEDMARLNELNTSDNHQDIWSYKRQQMY